MRGEGRAGCLGGRGRAGGKTWVPTAIQRPGSAMCSGAGAEDQPGALLIEALQKRHRPFQAGGAFGKEVYGEAQARMREPECWPGPTFQQQTPWEPGWGRSGVGDWRQRDSQALSHAGVFVWVPGSWADTVGSHSWGSSSCPFQEDPQMRPPEADQRMDATELPGAASAQRGQAGGRRSGPSIPVREAGWLPAWK